MKETEAYELRGYLRAKGVLCEVAEIPDEDEFFQPIDPRYEGRWGITIYPDYLSPETITALSDVISNDKVLY